jgi:hypothetical protein
MPARLASRWQGAGCPVVLQNLGVNGFTTDDLISWELPQVRPFAPTRVTLAIGANDIVQGRAPEEYRARVKLILADLVGTGVTPARVFVLPLNLVDDGRSACVASARSTTPASNGDETSARGAMALALGAASTTVATSLVLQPATARRSATVAWRASIADASSTVGSKTASRPAPVDLVPRSVVSLGTSVYALVMRVVCAVSIGAIGLAL